MPISINYYLDTRAEKKQHSSIQERQRESQEGNDAVFPIKLTITKSSRTAYLSTGIFVRKDQWKNKRIIGRSDKVQLNHFLDNYLFNARSIVQDGRMSGRFVDWSATEIKNEIARLMENGEINESEPTLYDAFKAFSSKRPSERTREIYQVTWRKISLLYPFAERITLKSITLAWLEDFDERLIARGNNPSTRNLDLRNLRAVIRYAKKHKLMSENPFEDFDMPKSLSPNRFLSANQLRAFINARLEPWEEKYRDFFLLSFYLIGINTEDLLHIVNIVEDRILYTRSKTGKEMSVKVEAEALSIINKYKGKRYLLNILDTYQNTHNWTAKVDSELKKIASRIGLPPITIYWARHTWATIAYNDLQVHADTITDALGHQPDTNKVTHIYIRKRNSLKVDEANRRMIDYVHNAIDQ